MFSQLRNLMASGRLFFESQDVLSPHDTNGRLQDIYEWSPTGVGGCARPAGCLALVSSGHAATDSYFLDATPSGDDAYFISRAQLVPADRDGLLDVYDARVGGGIAEASAASCAGEACKGAIAPTPAQPSSGSSTFSGPGNPKAKHKKHHKKHKKHHKKSKHKKHHKKSKHKKHHKSKKAKHKRMAGNNRGGSK